jgi:hypothetical protein
MKKLVAILLTSVLLLQFVPSALAKPKGDWEAVKAAANHALAVKTKSGTTHFGLIQSIDDSGLKIQLAAPDDMTSQIINLQRDEVAQVWRATLRFDENYFRKGGYIGAGVGIGALVTVAAVESSRNVAEPNFGAVLLPALGTFAGAVVGGLWKKKHKKNKLIYSV